MTVGMERLQQGRLAAALQWLGRAGDEGALDAAARPLVQSIADHAASPSSQSGEPAPAVGQSNKCNDQKWACISHQLVSF